MIIHSSQSSKDFDQAAVIKYGVGIIHLMEIAGKACADEIDKDFAKSQKKTLILCGPGNNGGDGFVVARFLISMGWNVSVIILNPLESYHGASLENLTIIDQMSRDLTLGLQIVLVSSLDTFNELLEERKPDVIIDALYGVGLTRFVEGIDSEIIKKVCSTDIPVYAIDIPTGISADTGQILGSAIKATKTITFEAYKFGHLLHPGKEYSGEVVIKELGLPAKLKKSIYTGITFQSSHDLISFLNIKPSNSNKGDFGKAYIYGGSIQYQGAFQLALRSCLKGGVGLLHGLYKDSLSPIFSSRIPPEVIHRTLPVNYIGEIDIEKLISFMSMVKLTKTAIGIGPGLGREADVILSVQAICRVFKGKLLVDADGLYAIKDILSERVFASNLVLTPHLGEMSYLTGLSVEDIEKDLISVALEYASKWNCTLVLKCASTIVADQIGRLFVNRFGNPGMAKGGSGDILAGIITSFLAQGYSPWDASVFGVSIHSLAGDMAARINGYDSMLPTDIVGCIAAVFQDINQ